MHRFVLIFFFVLLLGIPGCTRPSSTISYQTFGTGPSTLVFIHCWSCNMSYFKNQIETLSQKYKLVLLDLPGHGSSYDRELPEYNVKTMASSAEELIKSLQLKNIILVGSSMGGPISLQIAGDMPGIVQGIVCVDTLQNADAPRPKEMFESAVKKMKVDFAKTVREFIPMFFPQNADPTLVKWVADQAAESNPKAVIPLFASLADIDTPTLLKNSKVPIRCINSKPYGPMAMPTAADINKKYADFDVIEMDGTGHFPMLERPGEFNDKFEKALESITLAYGKPQSK